MLLPTLVLDDLAELLVYFRAIDQSYKDLKKIRIVVWVLLGRIDFLDL